jgi:hypothetical protein
MGSLLLMVLTLALLILPGTHHRIAENGNASGRFHALTDKVADIALIPFMASLAIDVAITGERIFGMAGGIAAGIAVGVLALFFWYGIEIWRKRRWGYSTRVWRGTVPAARGRVGAVLEAPPLSPRSAGFRMR